jgi:hypothetical protein
MVLPSSVADRMDGEVVTFEHEISKYNVFVAVNAVGGPIL